MAKKDDSPESLLKLAQDRSVQGRRSLATAMSDLFAERESVLSDREHALMTDSRSANRSLIALTKDCRP